MTEKHYGGSDGRSKGGVFDAIAKNIPLKNLPFIGKSEEEKEPEDELTKENIEKLKKAGAIAKEVREYARSFIKKDMPLLEIANRLDEKILELKAKPAFPVNLSINEIAAHSTPGFNDTEKARGLLKVDIGVHIDGFVADTAFSLDLDNLEENKKLIKSSELALQEALKTIKVGVTIAEIGEAIETKIKSFGALPIQNLSGHEIKQYDLHAGLTIPNFNNSSTKQITSGVYAIEPFSTSGFGAVRDGKVSGIYMLQKEGQVRDAIAREVLKFIVDEHQTLPFCSREIYKKFGVRGLLALKRIEDAGLLHHYPQLIEKSGANVAQTEHTVIVLENEIIITTL